MSDGWEIAEGVTCTRTGIGAYALDGPIEVGWAYRWHMSDGKWIVQRRRIGEK